MKTLVVYSSRTGNTEKVARAVAEGLHACDIYPVKDAPNPSGYDFVAVGYWVDKGMPDADAKRYLESIENCTVALFGTLGAWPDSEHAADCKKKGEDLLNEPQRGNRVLGSFLCQGRVDPSVVTMMQKMADNAHPMTDERRARLEEAARHPDQKDCRQAREYITALAATV